MHLTYPAIVPAPRRGFTLIELLTVIAIIGILAAIIIPTVGKVRSSARTAQSAANLREVGRACLMLSELNKGVFPHGDSAATATPYHFWSKTQGLAVILQPDRVNTSTPDLLYSQNPFWDGTVMRSPNQEDVAVKISYAPNQVITGLANRGKHRLLQNYNPSQVILFGDASRTNALNPDWSTGKLNARNGASGEFAGNGRALVVYIDGHVGSFSSTEAAELNEKTTDKAKRAWGEL